MLARPKMSIFRSPDGQGSGASLMGPFGRRSLAHRAGLGAQAPSDAPCSVKGLNKHQWREVVADTALVLFTLSLVWALLSCGAAVIMEHPAFPVWANGRACARASPASAWALRVVRVGPGLLVCRLLLPINACLVPWPENRL